MVHDITMPNADLARPRWDDLDLWRGYMLCAIFINHVPGNVFEPLTQKNYGFSDSAEGFVFLCGMSIALAYERRLARGEWSFVTRALLRRSAKLYLVHVALSLLGLAVFAIGAAVLDSGTLMQAHGRDLATTAPGTMLVGVLTLGHQFGYFNILPMYILLIVMSPALLWLGRSSPWPMLAASFTIYAVAIARGWNLPTWPEPGGWFFDPFAWQFLMALGIAIGRSAPAGPVPRMVPVGVAAAAIVAFSAFSVTNGFSLWPGFEDWTRNWAQIDKTTLGLGRLVHFFALAYLIHGSGITVWLRLSPVFRPLCMIGRHSLWTFALLSLLAAIGQVLMHAFGHVILTDAIMMASGLGALYLLALRLDAHRKRGGAGTTVSAPNISDLETPGLDLGFGLKSRMSLSPRS